MDKDFRWEDGKAQDQEMAKGDSEGPMVTTKVLTESESTVIGSRGPDRHRGRWGGAAEGEAVGEGGGRERGI